MIIDAIKFAADPRGTQPARVMLDTGSSGDLEKAKRADLPAAYVVRSKDLDKFREFTDLVVDRGAKNPAMELSRLLLGRDKIPLIEGRHRDAGQLRRSIRTLLANAVKREEQNLYIVGAEDAIFDLLWEQAGRPAAGKTDKKCVAVMDMPGIRVGRRSYADGEGVSSRLLLDILGHIEEPPGLAQRFIGGSWDARLVRQMILRAARQNCTVLIIGDTGTGKEVAARAIHDFGARQPESFTAVNCGAIPGELLESELFGHKKGAFTTALNKKKGLWEVADKGTLFLDEIGDLSISHQAKILRALETGNIRPIGAEKEIRVRARVIAATNRDLYSMVRAGQFREDLFYRLQEFLINTPPLRNHPGDIPDLARMIWEKITGDKKKFLHEEILTELQALPWPGNTRELKTVLSKLYTMFGADNLGPGHLRAVFLLQGLITADGSGGKTAKSRERLSREVQSLSHLKQVEEAVHGGKAALRTFIKYRKPDYLKISTLRESLMFRLESIEALCHPDFFQDKILFSRVNGFRGNLAFSLKVLRDDAKKGLLLLRKDVLGDADKTLRAVSKEIARLVGKAAWK